MAAANPLNPLLSANPFNLTNVPLFSAPTLIDIDGDGDLDAFIGAEDGDTYFFKNNGTAVTPDFAAGVINPFGFKNVAVVMGDGAIAAATALPQFDSVPNFVDIDRDGDLDVFVGTYPYGVTLYYQNVGNSKSPSFAAPIINPFGLKKVNEYTSPAFVDIDKDGDLDAFIGTYESGDIVYFQNIGTAQKPVFAAPVANPFGLENTGIINSCEFADLDKDGDLDAFVGVENGDTLFFENTGTSQQPKFAGAIANPFGLKSVGEYSNSQFVDIDNDGDLDALIGNKAGETYFFENIASPTSHTPNFISYKTTKILGDANKIIHGDADHDFIRVSGGNNEIHTGDGRNQVYGGSGQDLIYGGAGDDVLYGGAGHDVIQGGSGDDQIDGGSGNDELQGGNGQDRILGGAGNDWICGGGGDDSLDGGEGVDTVDYSYWNGGGRYDLAQGLASFVGFYQEEVRNFENIQTGSGKDYIVGTVGANVIKTGGGDDILMGGGGADKLTGGDGADRFCFTSLSAGVATLTDFSWRQGDRIEIDASSFGATSTRQFAYNCETGALSFNASPSDGIQPQVFAVLANRPSGFSTACDIRLV